MVDGRVLPPVQLVEGVVLADEAHEVRVLLFRSGEKFGSARYGWFYRIHAKPPGQPARQGDLTLTTSSPVCSDCPSAAAHPCAASTRSSAASSAAISSGALPSACWKKEARKESSAGW